LAELATLLTDLAGALAAGWAAALTERPVPDAGLMPAAFTPAAFTPAPSAPLAVVPVVVDFLAAPDLLMPTYHPPRSR
jgi:hypothetical protein